MNRHAPSFGHLARLVRRRAGLTLPADSRGLLESKLGPVAERFGFKSLSAMLRELEDEPDELSRAVTEALTTNETSFFRDPAVFDYLKTAVLPALMAARTARRRLRIWCAAASAGQEAYSLAILLDEAGLFRNEWKVDLFATDLRRDAVRRMHEGSYSSYEAERGLRPEHIETYFHRDGDRYRVATPLRRRLRVHRFNLLDSFGWLGELDLILCRNTLFYFADEEKRAALARLNAALAPDGWLVLGATEGSDVEDWFAPAGDLRGVYVKKAGTALRRAG